MNQLFGDRRRLALWVVVALVVGLLVGILQGVLDARTGLPGWVLGLLFFVAVAVVVLVSVWDLLAHRARRSRQPTDR